MEKKNDKCEGRKNRKSRKWQEIMLVVIKVTIQTEHLQINIILFTTFSRKALEGIGAGTMLFMVEEG